MVIISCPIAVHDDKGGSIEIKKNSRQTEWNASAINAIFDRELNPHKHIIKSMARTQQKHRKTNQRERKRCCKRIGNGMRRFIKIWLCISNEIHFVSERYFLMVFNVIIVRCLSFSIFHPKKNTTTTTHELCLIFLVLCWITMILICEFIGCNRKKLLLFVLNR